jgi:hypothetical protein
MFASDELTKLPAVQAGKFHEVLISWSLHEIYKNEELLAKLRKAHESDGYKIIHWVFWTYHKIHQDKMHEFKNFSRSEGDILETLKLCLKLGSSPLDTNDRRGESAIGSLIASFDKGLMSKATFEAAYDLLTSQDENNMARFCKSIANKITDNKDTNAKIAPIICWLVHRSISTFCDSTICNLTSLTNKARDTDGFYLAVKNYIDLIVKLLHLGLTSKDNRDFNRYFKLNVTTSSQLISKFITTMSKVSSSIELDEYEKKVMEMSGNKFNLEVIGAIVGEVSTDDDTSEYSRSIVDSYPMVAKTCLVHRKAVNAKFICPKDLVSGLASACVSATAGYIQFQITSSLQKILGRKLTSSDIKGLGSVSQIDKKYNDDADVSDGIHAVDDVDGADGDGDGDDDIPVTNPFEDRVNIEDIRKLKDSDEVKYNSSDGTYTPNFIDDMVYGLSRLVKEAKKNKTVSQLMEVIASHAMENIHSEGQINAFVKILTENNWLKMLQEVITKKGDALLENFESDSDWPKRVLEILAKGN